MGLSCQLFTRTHKEKCKSVRLHCHGLFILCASNHKTQNFAVLGDNCNYIPSQPTTELTLSSWFPKHLPQTRQRKLNQLLGQPFLHTDYLISWVPYLPSSESWLPYSRNAFEGTHIWPSFKAIHSWFLLQSSSILPTRSHGMWTVNIFYCIACDKN